MHTAEYGGRCGGHGRQALRKQVVVRTGLVLEAAQPPALKHSGQSRHLGHQHLLSASFASWLTNEPCFCRHVLPWPSATFHLTLKMRLPDLKTNPPKLRAQQNRPSL